jgi:predicted dehydrogenase/threonine dehydrogenase-like Zn-dependent dehydrogenase
MQQLTQQLKSGRMEILKVPFPALNKGQILVRNHYSVISTGTEGKTVSDARKGYLAKAKSRQKEVRQVIEMIKTNGFLSTYKLVMNKLEAPSPLGYSCAGEVIAVADDICEFKVGDYVACGGNNAFHADVVSVPKNLAVKVPEHIDLKEAAFATIAAIAIQGIRQSEITLGSNCLIIGMGLIGQLTYKILEASGIFPIGIDISKGQVDFSKKLGLKNVFHRKEEGIEELILNRTNGYGVDAVIITAGTSSTDPVEFAGQVSRKKGKVVIVGAVPTGFDRANYYKKELDLRMSMSYGPGRGDANYEDSGKDYPIGYVRWTENRNMQSYIDLLRDNRLSVSELISHTFDLLSAPDAYDMILAREEVFSGVVIKYDSDVILQKSIQLKERETVNTNSNVGFIGAGSFAQGFLLPNMKGYCNFVGIATGKGNNAKYIGDKYGFQYLAESADIIIDDENINTVFITTRHDLHAKYVLASLKNGKHIFVEKPLSLNLEELEEVRKTYELNPHSDIMVGFNRRFAPATVDMIKNLPENESKSILIRVNAGIMPAEHWVNDPEVGGGRIVGEGCHFIDLAMFIASSPIKSVSSVSMKDANGLNNTVSVNLAMENGSIASVNYYSNGNKKVSKEYIEVYSAGTIAKIDDFKTLELKGLRSIKKKYKGQDKGHATCVRTYLNSIQQGYNCPVPFIQSYLSMKATFAVNKSIRESRTIFVD